MFMFGFFRLFRVSSPRVGLFMNNVAPPFSFTSEAGGTSQSRFPWFLVVLLNQAILDPGPPWINTS